ncbi:cytochrome P450 71A1 [Selaginella moellendorffii]|uniref:cytochrome P450 71A1 n=1 Tax=Selaginella moellendorffii TaxID=88036 RepID=UPI000D1C256D|nr:cytochrome P450 71A1 [Selaginella moellendorffii]|eukprot:XP_024543432.1 cytochrome P450 71A1 [Selaginella moellendorffii]
MEALSIILVGAATLVLCSLFASRFLYPLPPGPWGTPLFGHLYSLGELPHQTLSKLSKKYGPIMTVRLGMVPALVIDSPQWAREFLTTHDIAFASRPQNTNSKYLFFNGSDVGFSPYGEHWRNLKKLITMELFTAKKMEVFKALRANGILRVLKSIAAEEGNVVSIRNLLSMLNMNNISQMAFSKQVIDDPIFQRFLAVLEESLDLMAVFVLGDFIPFLKWFDPYGYVAKMKANRKEISGIYQMIIDEHKLKRKKNCTPTDLVDILLSQGVDETTIKGTIMGMFVAGTDTSSLTSEWALTSLINNPSCMKRAQEELDRVVGRERRVQEEDLSSLVYLKAIVKETFRLHPPAPLLLPRESTQECTVKGGYKIPKGTRLIINTWSIGRDPSLWESPEEFKPERFLEKSIDIKGQDFELIPFGAGRRICAGLPLGQTMVELTLASLLQAFEWKTDKTLDMEESEGLTTRMKVPLAAHMTCRTSLKF